MVQDLGVFKIWAVCTSVKSCKNKARLDPPMLVVVHYATIFHWLWTHGPIVYMPRIRIIKECKWLNGCGMAHNSEIFRVCVCVYIYIYVILYVCNIREFDIIYIYTYVYVYMKLLPLKYCQVSKAWTWAAQHHRGNCTSPGLLWNYGSHPAGPTGPRPTRSPGHRRRWDERSWVCLCPRIYHVV